MLIRINRPNALKWRLLLMMCILAQPSFAEEKSVMDGATSSDHEVWTAFNLNYLADGNFKTLWLGDPSDPLGNGTRECRAQLVTQATIHAFFFANRADCCSERLGKTELWIGNDTTPYSTTGLTMCSQPIYDTGLYPVTPPTTGDQIVLRRVGYSSARRNRY